ncbi:MAG TPA: hypothetical protein DCS79_02395, partial [Gammaproteobacteria bacterium]|nr:hypothetical protein [Gammaproteobacteria bacterium]
MQQKRRRSTTGQSRSVLFLRALVFLLGIATLANCAPTGSEHSPQELGDFNDDPRLQRGVSWQLSEHRKQTLSALEYDFSLVIPNERALPITGEATLRFRLTLNSDEDFPVVIDFVDAASRLDSITVNGKPSEWSLVEDHVLIPAAMLQEGDNSVTLIFEAGDAALNRSTDFLYTLFVPDRAHFSLPLIDQPNLKGSVAWTISAPHNWQVVANGSELSVDTAQGNGSNQLQNQSVRIFARTEPLPTYLFAFAA